VWVRFSNTSGFADGLLATLINHVPLKGDRLVRGYDRIYRYNQADSSFSSYHADEPAFTIFFGANGDIPLMGDWNGNNQDTFGVFRPSTGQFFLRNTISTGFADHAFVFGNPGDIPITGDWNCDGQDSVGVFRPSTGEFFLRPNLLSDAEVIALVFGNPNDQPVAGDWLMSRCDSIGVFRDGLFFLRDTLQSTSGVNAFAFGMAGDLPLMGRWYIPPPDSAPQPVGSLAPTFVPRQ
jgi:hypothetical protein